MFKVHNKDTRAASIEHIQQKNQHINPVFINNIKQVFDC